ncbi:MAG: helix-turn-helix domain-containing protein [Clostridia bacterium]|nr:helix-turn-helix domain-containing protein [Clostridia bacterium]
MLAFYYENRKTDFSVADCCKNPRRLGCSAHLHNHIELVFMIEGDTLAFADTEQCRISSGDAFIAFPNQIHRYESTAPEKFFIFIVRPTLTPSLAETFTGSVPRSNLIKGLSNDPDVRYLIDKIMTVPEKKDLFTASLQQGYLLALFSLVLSKTELATHSSTESQTLKSIISYCMQHYQNELSLSLLARDLHISKYYISHLFSDKLLIGFNDYINSLRISYACRYLRHSTTPITEIASLVGFNTSRTFNRAFVRQMGITPSDYRRTANTK